MLCKTYGFTIKFNSQKTDLTTLKSCGLCDVANAFYLLGLYGQANKGYVIGSGSAKPLREYIEEMCTSNAKNNPPLFGNVPFTGVDISIDKFSTKDIEQDCGFKATVSFAEGTRRTIEWLKEVD